MRYVSGKPSSVTDILPTIQHVEEMLSSTDGRRIVKPYVCKVLPANWISDEKVWRVNQIIKFVIGGSDGDCALTCRKIIVGTYVAQSRMALAGSAL